MKKLLLSGVAIAMLVAVGALAVQAGGRHHGEDNNQGSNLIHTETVGQSTTGAATWGPAGSNCDATNGGSACAYVTVSITGNGNTVPFGSYTLTGTATLLFGVGGKFITVAGEHDDAGNPTGFCTPFFATGTEVYGGGSLSFNQTGTYCCASANASTDCPATDPFGPPSTSTLASVITGGTGIFANASGDNSGNDSQTTDSGPAMVHKEGVIQLAGGSSSGGSSSSNSNSGGSHSTGSNSSSSSSGSK